MVFRSRRRRKRAAAGKCAVAAQCNISIRRSPCGDSGQCESLTENGKRCQGQIWQLLTLAGPFLKVLSLVGPALTSSSGRRLDQVSRKLLVSSNLSSDPLLQELRPPPRNNQSNIAFHRKNHLLQKFRRTKIELSLITSLEFVPQIVRFRILEDSLLVSHERHVHTNVS